MFRLTREVRFAVDSSPQKQAPAKPTNSYAGYPSLTGFGHYLTLAVTLHGELRADSSYLRNIKDIDDAVRRLAIPIVAAGVREGRSPVDVLHSASGAVRDAWAGTTLDQLTLTLSPFLSLTSRSEESPM